MQIDSLDLDDQALIIKCSGAFGIGSEGNPSGQLLVSSIEAWMHSHPSEHVEQLVIDLSEVDYSWGDAPVSSLIPLIKKGVNKVRLVPGPRNRQPLRDLVDTCNLPWFFIEA